MFHENAEEFGLPYDGPPAVRRESVDVATGRTLSALVWGDGRPELVLLHGGAQNAHTWDTVALALDRPLVAIDLPGHGHSDWRRRPAATRPRSQRRRRGRRHPALAPDGPTVVGMSLGGHDRHRLAAPAPRARAADWSLVDVTPGVDHGPRPQPIVAFIDGPERFETSTRSSTARWSSTRPARSRRCGAASCTTRPSSATTARGSWRYDRFRPENLNDERRAARRLRQHVGRRQRHHRAHPARAAAACRAWSATKTSPSSSAASRRPRSSSSRAPATPSRATSP